MYEPEVNDYVTWERNKLKGWVYFKCDQYITIEIMTKPITDRLSIHKFNHVCILCFPQYYHELNYITTRSQIHHGLEESTNRFNNGRSNDDSIDQSNASNTATTTTNAQPIE